jgi:hypothetical protein
MAPYGPGGAAGARALDRVAASHARAHHGARPALLQVQQALALSIEWLEDMLWHGSRVQLAGGIQ